MRVRTGFAITAGSILVIADLYSLNYHVQLLCAELCPHHEALHGGHMWRTVADWLVVLGTLAVAVVAVFQNRIRAWMTRPRLRVTIRNGPPDCALYEVKITEDGTVVQALHIRLRIENESRFEAEKVEVYAERLARKLESGEWEEVTSFLPMNLQWTNRELMPVALDSLPALTSRQCELAHITNPWDREHVGEFILPRHVPFLAFGVVAPPKNLGHMVASGVYKLALTISAKSMTPLKVAATITLLRGFRLSDDEKQMMRDIHVEIEEDGS